MQLVTEWFLLVVIYSELLTHALESIFYKVLIVK